MVEDIYVLHLKVKQEGPSYLNMTLRYLGPLDPRTFGLMDLFPL